jgi:tRNA/tmRNA/rRNA uracil-C5-methylase (TrmA/RlmC/RlmD family)
LARRDGKVIFIEGVVPGDVVDVRLGKNKKDWAEGQAIRFHDYSKEGKSPFASILVFAAAASGRCCLTKSNWNTNTSRCMITSPG